MTPDKRYRLHATVTGRVQGVGFRYHILKAAQENNLTGWVRNLRDGRVEVIAEGCLCALNLLLQSIRKGPPSAVVDDVQVNFTDSQDEFSQFSVRSTA